MIVGSVALDSIETNGGSVSDALGGSALYFSWAASMLNPVKVVGVVGDDYPMDALDQLADRGVDISGIEQQEGESFRWAGRYSPDFNDRETLDTRLGVFAEFSPKIPETFRDSKYVFLGNIQPELQLSVLDQIEDPALVVCDTMNFWIDGNRDALMRVLTKIDVLRHTSFTRSGWGNLILFLHCTALAREICWTHWWRPLAFLERMKMMIQLRSLLLGNRMWANPVCSISCWVKKGLSSVRYPGQLATPLILI